MFWTPYVGGSRRVHEEGSAGANQPGGCSQLISNHPVDSELVEAFKSVRYGDNPLNRQSHWIWCNNSNNILYCRIVCLDMSFAI